MPSVGAVLISTAPVCSPSAGWKATWGFMPSIDAVLISTAPVWNPSAGWKPTDKKCIITL